MQKTPFIIFLTTVALLGCRPKEQVVDRGEIAARVGDKMLYVSEVRSGIADNLRGRDSTEVMNEYIQNWIKETVLINKAHAILTSAERDKSKLVSQYYNDLIIHEMEQKLVRERLDTAVSEEAIVAYYQANRKNFELKENIVRLRFFSIPKEIKDINKLWSRFVEGGNKNLMLLKRICEKSNSNYFDSDSVWLSFNDVLKELPINTYNQESYLNNHRFVRLDERNYVHFIEILDFRVKNNTSPLDFERKRIKDIILHKRKVELLQQIEEEIVREAYTIDKIETF